MHSGNQPPRKASMHTFKPPRKVGRWAPITAAILSSTAMFGAVAGPAHAALTSFELTYNTADVIADDTVDVAVNRVGLLASGTTAGDPVANEFGINDAALMAALAEPVDPGTTPPDIALGCWNGGYTPQILPGDSVSIAGGGTITVPDMTASKPAVQGGDVVVTGTAPAGVTAGLLSVQLLPAGADLGNKFAAGKQFYDTDRPAQGQNDVLGILSVTGTQYTARFTGLSGADIAALGNSVISYNPTALDAADPAVETIIHYEGGATPGGIAGCPAYAPNEAKSVSRSVINGNATDLLVSGVAQPNASATAVTLTDSRGNSVSAPAAGPAWTATIPAGQLQSLADGPISIGSTSPTGRGARVPGLLNKAAPAPSAPTASVSAGTYSSTQNVSLSSSEGTIRYTTDGSDPTSSSKAYSKAIPVSSSTTIKAVAIDAAGNTSDVSSFGYTIAAPVVAPQQIVAPVKAPKLKLDALTLNSR